MIDDAFPEQLPFVLEEHLSAFEEEWQAWDKSSNVTCPRLEDRWEKAIPALERSSKVQRNRFWCELLYREIWHRRKLALLATRQHCEERFKQSAEFLCLIRHVFDSLGPDPDETLDPALPPSAKDLLGMPTWRIGRYVVERRLGRGSFGTVFLARDDDLKRLVAIKVPHQHCYQDPVIAETYLAEAQVLAKLNQPNIVPVHDFGRTHDGLPFVVSKFIEGTNLEEKLRQTRFPFAEAAHLVATVAEALHHAHGQKLIHRDIKPANILIGKHGIPHVADFGLTLQEKDFGKPAGGPIGSPAYMSPEQARGDGNRVDGRSDIFSLGVVFYELLIGERPFRGTSNSQVLEQIKTVEARPPRQLDDRIPIELERICLKALSKAIMDRFPTAKDFADELRKWIANSVVPASTSLFELLQEANLFGRSENPGEFVPSREEYAQGHVHRPALADQVEARLKNSCWALVRGKGAAGKTVLATMIGLGSTAPGERTYYLDLKDKADDDDLSMLEALSDLAHPTALFVIDNIHLDEKFANRLFHHWQKARTGSRLLLLGRQVEPGPNPRGLAPPVAALDSQSFLLKIEPEDLVGVLRRLLHRFDPNVSRRLQPSPSALARWHQLFGGDLIAFSAAVSQRIRSLAAGDWQLRPGDPAQYVRTTYLDNHSMGERSALLTLAAMASLELDTPDAAIERGRLETYIQAGIVHKVQRGRDGHIFYRLVHPGLGELLRAADPKAPPSLTTFIEVTAKTPLVAFPIARRLMSLRETNDAIAVLKSVTEPEERLVRALTPFGLPRPNCLELLTDLAVLSKRDLESVLVRHASLLADAAVWVSPQIVAHFLDYAGGILPDLHHALARELTQPERIVALIQRSVQASPEDMTRFLDYSGRKLPDVHRALAAALAQPAPLEALTQTAIGASPDTLAHFLDYAGRKLPDVHRALAAALAQPARLEALTQTAIGASPDKLAHFLDYAGRKLPDVHRALAAALAQPARLEALTQTAIGASPDKLAHFLDYAGRKLPDVHRALAAALAQPARLEALTQTAIGASPDKLAHFLDYAGRRLPDVHRALAAALAQPARLEALTQTAIGASPDTLAHFLDYAGRKLPDVHRALAAALAQPARLEALTQTAIGASPDKLAHFLDYAGRMLPEVYNLLTVGLTEPNNLRILAGTALRAPLEHLTRFVEGTGCAASVIAVMDLGEWTDCRLSNPLDRPDCLPRFARTLLRLGRPELAEAPARALIRAADARHWHIDSGGNRTTGIVHLSYTLRLGRDEGTQGILAFLERAIGQEWLREQFANCPAGALAAALFALWASQEGEVIAWFRNEALRLRLEDELIKARTLDATGLYAVVQLLGCCAAIGVETDDLTVPGFAEGWVQDVFEVATTRRESPELNHEPMQFWLGLREMARLAEEPIEVPISMGAQTLGLWKANRAVSAHQERLDAWMIDWLERCSASEWSLLPDKLPLAKGFAIHLSAVKAQTPVTPLTRNPC